MANLTGFNIGANQRGILNIGSTINTPLDATLRSVTDGLGNASPLQLSTTEASVLGNFSVGAAVNATGFGQRIRVIGQGDASVGVYRNQATSSPAKFEFMKSRGTYDSPLVVNNLDEIGSLGYFAFNGTSYSNSARVYARAVSSTGTGVEGELLTTLWNNTGSNFNMLRLTLTGLGIGNSLDYTPSARLHVRGDGTNPIARFEQLGGTATVILTAGGQLSLGNVAGTNPVLYPYASSLVSVDTSGENLGFYSYKTSSTSSYDFSFQGNNISITSGTRNVLSIIRTFAAGTGSGNFRPLNIEYTINASGPQTGTATGIFLNATPTALDGMTHNLMDLQSGGASRFRVSSNGRVSISEHLFVTGFVEIGLGNYFGMANRFKITSPSDGVITFFNNNQTDFNRLQFGGTTNAFPALKRETTALSVRLADDSAYTFINASGLANGNLTTNFLSFVPNGMRWQQNGSAGTWSDNIGFHVNIQAQSNTSGYNNNLGVTTNFTAAAGSANFQPFRVIYGINNSGAQTGTATGIFLNATETALNGMGHNLIDLQRGGVSQFLVTNGGTATFQRGIIGAIQNNAINNFNNTVTMFTLGATSTMYGGALFQFGGTTNAFPALKRNSASLDIRLADDSGYANLNTATIVSYSGSNFSQINSSEIVNSGSDFSISSSDINRSLLFKTNTGSGRVEAGRFDSAGSFVVGKGSAAVATALVELTSTTKGFLPPRMTEAQRLAIAGGTPEIGLMVYQTDASDGLYVYKAGGWTLII